MSFQTVKLSFYAKKNPFTSSDTPITPVLPPLLFFDLVQWVHVQYSSPDYFMQMNSFITVVPYLITDDESSCYPTAYHPVSLVPVHTFSPHVYIPGVKMRNYTYLVDGYPHLEGGVPLPQGHRVRLLHNTRDIWDIIYRTVYARISIRQYRFRYIIKGFILFYFI